MDYLKPTWERGTMKLRDGALRVNPDPERWRKALRGHTTSAHNGRFVETCPACKELRDREIA
jgi:hypothetical protein